MSIFLPEKCWRGRKDCKPYHAIEGGTTKKGKPKSFVCCGCVNWKDRAIPQDAYRLCWKNDHVDEMGDYNERDLAHTMAVLSQALAIINCDRVNRDLVEAPKGS